MTIVKDDKMYMPIFTDADAAYHFRNLGDDISFVTYIVPSTLRILLDNVYDAGVDHVVINPEPSDDSGNKKSPLAPNGYIYPLKEYIDTISRMQIQLN